jgi:signal transduction histidine kinase
LKISQKMVILFIILIVSSGGIISYTVFQYAESSIVDNRIKEMKYVLLVRASEVETLHARASEDIKFAARNQAFVEYFSLPETRAGDRYVDGTLQFTPAQHQLKNELDQWIFDFQNKFSVDETCLVDRTGQEHTRLVLHKVASDYELSATEEDTPFFTPSFQTDAGQVHIQYPYVSPDTHRWVFAYTTPIVLADGTKPAFYHFEMPISIFQNLIKTDDGRMYVLDPNGYLIADSGYDFASKTVVDSERDYFPPISSISGSAGFASLGQKIVSARGDGIGMYSEGSEVHYVVYKQLPTFGWVVAYDLPYSNVLAGSTSVQDLRNLVIGTTIGVAAVGGVLVVIVSRKITRPISRVVEACRSQSAGQLQKIDIKTGDEVGEVIHSLNSLIEKVSEHDRQSKAVLEKLSAKDAELEKAYQNLSKIDKSKDEFIAMVSHELKTPLTPMKIYLDMFRDSESLGGLNEGQAKAVSVIAKNLDNLEGLIGDILDVYKLDMGKMKFDKQNAPIQAIVDDNVSSLRSFTVAKGIQLAVDIRAEGDIICDPKRIGQVLANLVKNSVDFVPAQGGRINIKVEAQNGMAVFAVEDNGPGIAADKADGLFKKFYQIDTSATRKHGGSGLGLSICKGIVEAHGGTIWMDKSFTKGLLIKFTIPRRDSKAQ